MAEVSPQRWTPWFESKLPVSGLALWFTRVPAPMVPQPSPNSFPPIRTCALRLLGGSVADHVTKRVPASLATIAGLKSNDVPLREKEQSSSIVAVSALTR